MPSDANGVYSLPAGYLAVTGEAILASQHNPPLEDLAESMSQRVMATGAKPFTGPVKLADGAVAAPGLTFSSATSTGVYKTTDGIGVSIGGVLVAEFTTGGLRTGARYLGELIPYAGLTAQALTVLPYGQTLSRTTYAAMWAYAQVEIAAGNTFYNNGNGSTTFGIGDLRGRSFSVKDNLGGSAASRLTSASMTPDGNTIGATGGTQSHPLAVGEIPTITSLNGAQLITVGNASVHIPFANSNWAQTGSFATTGATTGAFTAGSVGDLTLISGSNSISVTSSGTGGATGALHLNVQPSMVVGCMLFVGA